VLFGAASSGGRRGGNGAASPAAQPGARNAISAPAPSPRTLASSAAHPSRRALGHASSRQKSFVPPALSALRKPVDRVEEATILPFKRRDEAALTMRAHERPIVSKEDQATRTAKTMEAARRNMADAMARLGDYLPEGAVKDDLMQRSRDILARADAATKEQERLERSPGQIEGNRFVEPEPRNVGALFTSERKGTETHYNRHDRESGAFQTLAFIDNGKQLDVRDWSNKDSVNAALKLASQKWETLSVSGSDEYKETVARLAAEHGYKIQIRSCRIVFANSMPKLICSARP
jgi:Large polyvalent protein-associated domain 7